MWRYHAVHHSPHRLYWLNVGRFHPIEKAVQFAVDTLPFALLGVSTEVLAAYFVFYAVNGFFQHSNCDVRLGVLNYVVSAPNYTDGITRSSRGVGHQLRQQSDHLGPGLRHAIPPADREVGRLGLVNATTRWDFSPR